MDKEKFLVALADHPKVRFRATPFGELSDAEQVFVTVREVEAEVTSGGFRQYLESAAGDHADFAVEALEEIGAFAAARIVERALAIFGDEGPPLDQEARIDAIDGLSERAFYELEALDAAFSEYPDDLVALLYDYVITHRAEIHGLD